ncbi:hypothetical protein [Sinorhizobium meliloti]
MIREKTTFVIGAGASAEFGLPVGSGLARNIKKSAYVPRSQRSDDIAGDDYFYGIVFHGCQTQEDRKVVRTALDAIHKGIYTSVSIDAFIHRNHQDKNIERLGKALIALEIAKAEAGSLMQISRGREHVDTLDRNKLDDTWISHFFRMLTDGVDDPRRIGANISIICFNYDRCIEFYLRESITNAYRVDRQVAHDIVRGLNIIHPYGTLGELTLDGYGSEKGKLPFGPELDRRTNPFDIADGIRTYTEQAHDVDKVERIHEAIAECKNLVFLGFGFNNQNLDLLRVKHTFTGGAHPKNIYSTGFGLYQQVDATLKRRILDLFMDEKDHRGWLSRVHIEYGMGCKELFRIHDMNLTSFTQRVLVVDDKHGDRTSRLELYRSRIG